MSGIKLNAYIVIVLIALTAWAAKAARPTMVLEKPNTDFGQIPMEFNRWTGVEQRFSERTYELLKSCSLLLRLYTKGTDAPVELAIVHGADLGDFHQPEFCLEGQGLSSVKKGIVRVRQEDGSEFDAVSLIMVGGGQRWAFLYWFTSEQGTATSLGNYKVKVFADRLRARTIEPSAMIRLHSQVIGNDEQAIRHLVNFADDVVPYLNDEFDTAAGQSGAK